jgi:hypothetical protein
MIEIEKYPCNDKEKQKQKKNIGEYILMLF